MQTMMMTVKTEQIRRSIPPRHHGSMTQSFQRAYGLRPRKPMDYSHMHATVIHHGMTQYSLKRGLKKFKEVDEEAI
jgi:hypothetical protein